jgi:16S rRNA (guanine527-N7)-methyltransferase
VDESDRALLESWCLNELGRGLERSASTRIGRFLDLLGVWNRRLRLTGERDATTLVRKHVADSLACTSILPDAGDALDIGTGAGFPGVVLACVQPDVDWTLLDARQRPVSFLNEVIRGVPLERVRALAMRAEAAATEPTIAGRQRLVTSRAIRMQEFLRLARPLLAPGGCAVSMQTQKVDRDDLDQIVRREGYGASEVMDYRLPDGEPRRLVIAR